MAILILIFRRLPAVLLLKRAIPAMKTYQEALFSGWFGPMGVGAVFLSKIAREEMLQVYPTPPGQAEALSIRLINPIVLFIVLSSVFVHGTTIPLFKLGRKIRTRTLSHTSAKSTSKAVSKWYNGRFGGKSKSMDILITERNTLRNITYRPTLEFGNVPSVQHGYAIDMCSNNNDDIREEDLLPDDRIRQSAVNSAFEAQNIRFVEPVVSRRPKSSDIPITKTQAYEGRRRESVVDHVLAWFHRRSPLKPAEVVEEKRRHELAGDEDSATADDNTAKDSNTLQSSPNPSSVHVFDERSKLIVENTPGPGANAFVIDKSMPDWQERVKLKIRELQEMLQEEEKQDRNSDEEKDVDFASHPRTKFV